MIEASNLIGVPQEEISSMEIAKHMGKRDKMSYDTRSYTHKTWKNHPGFKVLHHHP